MSIPQRPTWLRWPGLRTQIALAVWGAVMFTNTMASSAALSAVDDSNARAIVASSEAVRQAQVSAWRANRDASAATFGSTRAKSGSQVAVWQVSSNRVVLDDDGYLRHDLGESPTWTSAENPDAATANWMNYLPAGTGEDRYWVGKEDMPGTATQAFSRPDGSVLVIVESFDPGADLSAALQLRTDLGRQGWALAILSALGAWLLSGALMGPARRTSAVAQRLGRGEFSARVRVTGRDEIATLGTQMNEMAGNLQQMIDAQRHFIGDTAHELRTPTTALLASAAALDDPSTRDEAAGLVSPQLRRLSSLTEDLLALSRFDDGREARDDQVVDLADLAERAAQQVAAGSDVRVRSEGPVFAIVDPARVSTIVRNLVANGLKHGEAPVVVVISEQGEDAVIRVSDSGDGVPADQRDAIFRRFVRGDQARHGEGAGLGLAIARENAELHGGSLTLGDDGHGFTLRVPLSPAPVEQPAGGGLVERGHGSSAVARPESPWPAASMLAAGLFWNGAVMFAWNPLLTRLLGNSPVRWGAFPGSGLLEEFPIMVGLPTLLVLAGRALAIHRGSPRLWRWQTAVWAPLPLYVFFFWHQSDLAGALLVAFVLWTITGGRTPRKS